MTDVHECTDCGGLTSGESMLCKRCAALADGLELEPVLERVGWTPTQGEALTDDGVGTVVVGPFTYRVTYEDVEHFRDDGKDLIGQVDYLSLSMRIAAKNAPAVQFAALWHETLHALSEMFGLELGERQVDVLSHGIAMVLRDNSYLRGVEL